MAIYRFLKENSPARGVAPCKGDDRGKQGNEVQKNERFFGTYNVERWQGA